MFPHINPHIKTHSDISFIDSRLSSLMIRSSSMVSMAYLLQLLLLPLRGCHDDSYTWSYTEIIGQGNVRNPNDDPGSVPITLHTLDFNEVCSAASSNDYLASLQWQYFLYAQMEIKSVLSSKGWVFAP